MFRRRFVRTPSRSGEFAPQIADFSSVLRVDPKTSHRFSFDSWGDMIDQAENAKPSVEGPRESHKFGWWSGTPTFAEAVDFARNGWKDGVNRAAKIAEPLIDLVASQLCRDEYRYDFTGIDFDMTRVLENDPESWIQHESVNVKAPGKILRIVCNCFVSSGISESVIIARGAVIAALIQLLERGGFRVQFDLVCAGKLRKYVTPQETWCTIKAPDQDLDLSRLIFAVAHPSMFRRIMFAIAETFPVDVRNAVVSGCYWSPSEALDQGDLYFGCAKWSDPNWANPTSARKWLAKTLQDQGIELSIEDEPVAPLPAAVPYVPPPPPSPEEQARIDAENKKWWAEWEKNRPAREAEEARLACGAAS